MYLTIILASMAPAVAAEPDMATAVVASEPMEPATNPGSWVTSDDYPVAAMRDEREGTTGFRLTIGPDGLPRQCDITASSGHQDLDNMTCRLVMERARFQQRRDARGVRVGGTYANRIRWQIPSDYLDRLARAGFHLDEARTAWPRGPIPDPQMVILDPADYYPAAALAARYEGEVGMTLNVDATGKVIDCVVAKTSMVAELDGAACALMREKGKFSPALDSTGKSTAAVVPVNFRWVYPVEASDTQASAVTGENSVRPLQKFPMSEPGVAAMSVRVNADGTATDCTYSQSGEAWLMGPGINPCDTIGGARRYIPFVDGDGNAVAKDVTLRIEMKIETASGATATKPPAP
ncbi:MAG: energy transducer TonB [Sphingopyxis sp.]